MGLAPGVTLAGRRAGPLNLVRFVTLPPHMQV